MANENSIWNHLKDDWHIKKGEIKDMGIDPNKNWGNIELHELDTIATHLDVLIEDVL